MSNLNGLQSVDSMLKTYDSKMTVQECKKKISERQSEDELYNLSGKPHDVEFAKFVPEYKFSGYPDGKLTEQQINTRLCERFKSNSKFNDISSSYDLTNKNKCCKWCFFGRCQSGGNKNVRCIYEPNT